MKRVTSPRAAMIFSMAVFGTLGLFVRRIAVSSAELALFRAVLASLLISAFLLLTRQQLSLLGLGRELFLLLLSGVAMGFNWILLFETYHYTTVSVATLSYYFASVLVTAASPLLFKEKLGPKQWLCSLMAALGIVPNTGTGELSGGSRHLIGILLGLGAACLLTVGLVNTGLCYCLYFFSLKELPGQEVTILSYIDPLVAVLVSVLALGEGMSALQALGGALILGFTLLNELPVRKKENDGLRGSLSEKAGKPCKTVKGL